MKRKILFFITVFIFFSMNSYAQTKFDIGTSLREYKKISRQIDREIEKAEEKDDSLMVKALKKEKLSLLRELREDKVSSAGLSSKNQAAAYTLFKYSQSSEICSEDNEGVVANESYWRDISVSIKGKTLPGAINLFLKEESSKRLSLPPGEYDIEILSKGKELDSFSMTVRPTVKNYYDNEKVNFFIVYND